MKVIDKTIKSKKLLKPEMRQPYQTTKFIYKALSMAELQIEEQFKELEALRIENLRLTKIYNRAKSIEKRRRKKHFVKKCV
jgi:hypothetical protein